MEINLLSQWYEMAVSLNKVAVNSGGISVKNFRMCSTLSRRIEERTHSKAIQQHRGGLPCPYPYPLSPALALALSLDTGVAQCSYPGGSGATVWLQRFGSST